MKKLFVSLSFILFGAFISQAQTQSNTNSSGTGQQYGSECNADQQYGEEWSADQQYGEEWNADQQYGEEWNPEQPNKNETDYVEEILFGIFRKK